MKPPTKQFVSACSYFLSPLSSALHSQKPLISDPFGRRPSFTPIYNSR